MLEATLKALLAKEDRRPLVRAMCASARRTLPRLAPRSPLHLNILETAEEWAKGTRTEAEVRAVREQAAHLPGGSFAAACVAVIVDDRDGIDDSVDHVAKQLPVYLWMFSEAGVRWAAKNGPRKAVGECPEATKGIAALAQELSELANTSSGEAIANSCSPGAPDSPNGNTPQTPSQATASPKPTKHPFAVRAPCGRIEARPTRFQNANGTFDPTNEREVRAALREAGPVRLVRLDANGEREVATLSPPEPSWSFGTDLLFTSTSQELFVSAPDLGCIFVYAEDEDTWVLRRTIRRPTALPDGRWWHDHESPRLVDDNHLWAKPNLLRRGPKAWVPCGTHECPIAVTRDWNMAVFPDWAEQRGYGVRIMSGTPYAWETTVHVLGLWRRPTSVELAPDGTQLSLYLDGVDFRLDNKAGRGWVQLGPIEADRRLYIEQPPAVLLATDFAAGRLSAIPWSLGVSCEAGTWIVHPKFGVGFIVTSDSKQNRMVVRFEDGAERRLICR